MCVCLGGWGGGSVKEERGKIGVDKIRLAFLLEKYARVCARKGEFIFRMTVVPLGVRWCFCISHHSKCLTSEK